MLSKPFLRSQARYQRTLFVKALSPSQLLQLNEEIRKNFWSSFSLQSFDIVSLYWPKGNEVDSRPLIKEILKRRFPLALPVVRADTKDLTFHLWCEREPLQENSFHVFEPLLTASRVYPTLVIVPLLAFDEQGTRLGYGQGYYDVTLSRLRAQKAIKIVGLAYEIQKVHFIPREMHDQTLDYVITELKVYKIKK